MHNVTREGFLISSENVAILLKIQRHDIATAYTHTSNVSQNSQGRKKSIRVMQVEMVT